MSMNVDEWDEESTLLVVQLLDYPLIYTFLREHLEDEELNHLALIGAGCNPLIMDAKFPDGEWRHRASTALHAFNSWSANSH